MSEKMKDEMTAEMKAQTTIAARLTERTDELLELLYEFRRIEDDQELQQAIIDDLFKSLDYVLYGMTGEGDPNASR